AESWIEAVSARDGLTRGQVRLISTAEQATSSDHHLEAPWLKQRTLTELLKSTPAAWSEKFRYSSAARSAQLTTAQLAGVRKFNASADTYADLLVDPTTARAEGAAAVARAASFKWR